MDLPEPNVSAPEPTSGLQAGPVTPSELQSGLQPPDTRLAGLGLAMPRRHDFRRPALLSSNESRKLHAQYEEFLRRLAVRLTNCLRLEVALKLKSIETLSFRKFSEALPVPTHLTLFKVEPLRGICVIELTSTLSLAMFDRMMGGNGQGTSDSRELSEIEAALIDHVVQLILEDWCDSCAKPPGCKPILLGHETDSRYLQTSPPDSTMFVVSLEVSLAEFSERIQLAFPFSTLESSIHHLRQELKGVAEASAEVVTSKPIQWNQTLEDMNLSLTAELPSLQTLARDLTRLKVGDTVSLPAEFANRVQMRLAGLLRFTGRLGTRDGRWAIEVTNIWKSRSDDHL